MPKKITEYLVLPLFRKFLNEIKKGKHLQSNGKKIKTSSTKNYKYLENLLIKYSEHKNTNLRIKDLTNLTKKQFDNEKKYWKEFYLGFTNFLYDHLNHYDNHVGRVIKLLRSFFNYLLNEKGLNIGTFHRKFYARSEDIEIIVLSPERLNYLIHNKEIEQNLDEELQKTKDVFVFGCSVGLRFSDLMALAKANIECINKRMYVKIQSKKTQTFTRVKLPEYAIAIINKYRTSYISRILPKFTNEAMNRNIKILMEKYGFTEPHHKQRQRRGIVINILKDNKNKTPFRLCDLITTHTMRRTAITNLLSAGLNEQIVRQISGHAANSREFFRYVSFAQTYMDEEIDKVHDRLSKKNLEIV